MLCCVLTFYFVKGLFLMLQNEQRSDMMETIKISWQHLQGRVNGIYDSNLAKIFTDSRPSYGVRQVCFDQNDFCTKRLSYAVSQKMTLKLHTMISTHIIKFW